ncbi:MAG: FtsH protease activity modulator HflK [Myxococcota bacterium]
MSEFDRNQGPDLRAVVDEYRQSMGNRLRWVGPVALLVVVVGLGLSGLYSVEPGEVGVVRTFGEETGQSEPGLHYAIPIVQRVDVVDMAKVRREEVGFRSGAEGTSQRVDAEALMLTGDENIIEAQMIVQYEVRDPSLFLFKLKDPEKTLHVAAQVALRGVVGQMRITSAIEELPDTVAPLMEDVEKPAVAPEDGEGAPEDGAEKVDEKKDDPAEAPTEPAAPDGAPAADQDGGDAPARDPLDDMDPSTDILTKGRERAQLLTKRKLQELMDLYESGLLITEVKLQVVDAPDEVKDAFHDVVRAREEREQLINKARGYREDRVPKARGEAQKIIRAAEGYRQERVLRARGEASRFAAILSEYNKARGVTRERLHLETIERVLQQVPKKVYIDEGVSRNALPLLNLNQGANLTAPGATK